jgi:2-oxoglutarate dehydrogenase complex dehydrogenase (E1) component-like enzyme
VGKSLGVTIHGDAAFAGQGVVAETLNMSGLPGYTVGGTVRIVVDNQIGFTTDPEDARSGIYCTDIAHQLQCPIFHVNADHPEACAYVARLAVDFRNRFHRDVIIDLVGYRRFGHNEGDDPSYTQPQMYKKIEARRTVRKQYTESLVNRGDLTLEEAEQALDWMLQQGLATSVEARVVPVPSERAVYLDIDISEPSGDVTSRAYRLADATQRGIIARLGAS